jgi:RimJ/RimL family protein N-acetyltransferase
VETLHTQRLLLEPWHERHRAVWRRICRDPEVMRFIALGEIWEAVKADKVFDSALAHWQERDFGWRSVLGKTSGDWLGFVGLNRLGPGVEEVAADEVEIGWWMTRAVWGRGYASEGASLIRDEGFDRVGLNRIIARLQPANTTSARVSEKIGLRFEREATGASGEANHIYALDRAGWKRRIESET